MVRLRLPANCLAFVLMLVLGQISLAESSDVGDKTANSDSTVDYLRQVRPILSDKCYACHGPDESAREADLRLDQLSALGATSSGRAAITSGSPAESELFLRITSRNPDERMPPQDSTKPLSVQEIDVLRRWIEQGAASQSHWAFVPPQRPGVPTVAQGSLPRNDIDRFIFSALERKGWAPSPAADKQTLIRRVTLQLTGLPPTLAEVDAFLGDDSPDAYERLVERLLQSPHYGEHMGRYWLDAARYGDTHGLHLDNYREMWLYRDWVVDAFNSNLPFNQFVVDQLAGDLLPEPTLEQRVATGFCRSNVSTNEGGSIEEEVYVRNVVDRVSTTGVVFMGLTLGCCACHDHKYDPITQREFYQLFAFFNSLDGPSLDGNVKDPAPVVNVPSEDAAAKLAGIDRVIAATRAECAALQARDTPEFQSWLDAFRTGTQGQGAGAELQVNEGLAVQCRFDDGNAKVVNEADAKNPGKVVGPARFVDGPIEQSIELSHDVFVELGNVGDVQDDQAFSFGAWVRPKNGADGTVLAKTGSGEQYRGYELSIADGRIRAQLGRRDPGYLITVITEKVVISPQEWRHVFVTYDGSKRASGLVVYVDGVRMPVEVLSDALKYKGGIRNPNPLLLGRRDAATVFEGQLDEARVYIRRLSDGEVQTLYLNGRLPGLRSRPEANWSQDDLAELRRYFLLANDQTFKAYWEQLDQLASRRQREYGDAPTTLVFREQRQPRDAFVLVRGQYDQHGEKVARLTPAALPPMEGSLPRNRLGLARWLVSPDHPLTARVAVNRLWQQFFGVGLVKTSEDFGHQGSPPSNPELLDWLAVEFRESGWDVKRLVKQMVTSATFRQSSRMTTQQVAEDPENRLLARGPRFRLDAEMLRDQALAVSGLLVDRLGGPSVKPPQPEGLWEAVGFIGSDTAVFKPDVDFDKTHRRSLYTFLKRTSPAPELTTFDAPSRESTCVRRERTNTPMQALMLMNDPQYVEAARGLAARAVRESESARERAAYIYRLCTSKRASESIVGELVQLYEKELSKYRRDEAATRKILGAGAGDPPEVAEAPELAAWTVVANLMLNLDEVINVN